MSWASALVVRCCGCMLASSFHGQQARRWRTCPRPARGSRRMCDRSRPCLPRSASTSRGTCTLRLHRRAQTCLNSAPCLLALVEAHWGFMTRVIHLFLCKPSFPGAAQAAIERRKAAAFIAGMHGGKAPPSPGRVSGSPAFPVALAVGPKLRCVSVCSPRTALQPALALQVVDPMHPRPGHSPGGARPVRWPGAAAALRPSCRRRGSQRRGGDRGPGGPAGQRCSSGGRRGAAAE